MKNYVDSQIVAGTYNDSWINQTIYNRTIVDTNIINVNTSMKNYVDSQDISYNTSNNNYIYSNNLSVVNWVTSAFVGLANLISQVGKDKLLQ
jgi:hypothetical protein